MNVNLFKQIFASFALAFALFLSLLVISLFIFGYDTIKPFVNDYMGTILIVLTIISFPVIKKYLK